MRNTSRKICMTFSKNLQYYMNLYGMDRQDLADKLEFKYSTVSNWLSCYSYASNDKIEKLANYFGISKSQLTENNNELPVINASLKKRKELIIKTRELTDEQIDSLLTIIEQFPKNS